MRSLRLLFLVAIAALLTGVLAGCSRRSPVEPEAILMAGQEAVPPPPSRLTTGGNGLISQILNLPWYILTQKLVLKGRREVVEGNRYELTFQPGSLNQSINCTIREYDKDVLDIELGPHGTQFKEPVTLSIDFRNTAADPDAAEFQNLEPVVWWWNEASERWEEVPGHTDWASRRHIVRLEHFSRYVVGGKAGWKHQPRTESE